MVCVCEKQLGAGGGEKGGEEGEGERGGTERELCVRAGVYERCSFITDERYGANNSPNDARSKIVTMSWLPLMAQEAVARFPNL